jgi:FkbM family methyltransferase
MISDLVSKLWKGNPEATKNIPSSPDQPAAPNQPAAPEKPAPAAPPMLFARNPHRTYEAVPIAKFALDECSDDFPTDFRKVISWCIKNCRDTRDHRSNFRMAPEPYGLEAGAGMTELLAHAESVVAKNIDGWKWLYPNLADIDSRLMLLSVLAYRSIGWRYVKMPMDNPDFWDLMHRLAYVENEAGQDMLQSGFIRLVRMDLRPFEFDIRLFSDAFGAFNEFIYSQYTYRGRRQLIAPGNNDYVFDCGACFGGTSLAFANRVGPEGKVFSFEFFPDNLKVFNLNLQENPRLAERIEIIEAPVWHHAGKELSIANSGPATAVYEEGAKSELRFSSVTIDDVVRERNLPRVDFIKMDIEGSEFYALRGAENTLRKFRPHVAACVYHKLIDFFEIPQLLHGLDLGYKFYLQHSTVHGDETVLFAQARD